MSERYCGFILIMPGKNRMSIAQQTRMSIAQQTRMSIAQQTRISIARRCLPKAGTSASWSKKNWTTPENFSLPPFVSLQARGVPFWVVKTTWHRTATVSIQCYSIPPSFESLPHLPPHCTTHSVLCIVYFIEFHFIG